MTAGPMERGALRPVRASATGLLLLVAACAELTSPPEAFVRAQAEDCAANAAAVSLTPAQLDSLPARGRTLTLEDSWALIAPSIPGGWAGLFYRGPVLVVLLVDTSQQRVALDSLEHFGLDRPANPRDLQIRLARWSVLQLYDWRSYLWARLSPPGRAVSVVFNPAANRIDFGAATAADRDTVVQQLRRLGVPCWLAAVGVVGIPTF